MERFYADLRWILLNKLVDFPYLDRIYQFFLLLFSFIAIYLIIYPFLPTKFFPKKNIYLNKIIQSDIFYSLITSGLIISGRWPGLLVGYINPDETLVLSGATKLLQDPIYWRSIDTTTSGPLNVYPLMIPSLFGLRLEYASARVIGLGLMIISVACLYYSLRCIYSKTTVRLATFVVSITIAMMRHRHFIHYTSEHLPIALLSIAILVCSQIYICKSNHLQNYLIFSLGFILGMSPFSKYQCIPISFAIFIVCLHIIWVKSTYRNQCFRQISLLIVGILCFPIFLFIYLVLFGLIDDFWKASIQTNLLFYIKEIAKLRGTASNWNLRISVFLKMSSSPEIQMLLQLTTVTVLLTSIIFFVKKSLKNPLIKSPNTSLFIYYSIIILIASMYSVAKPGNPFLHYMLFLIIPCGFTLGVFMGEIENKLSISSNQIKKSIVIIVTTVIIIICLRDIFDNQANDFISKRKEFLDNYIEDPVAQFIVNHSQMDESIAVWGLNRYTKLYIQTGLYPATRDIDNLWQIIPHPLQEFYLERYKNDLLKSQPILFVDTISAESTNIMQKSHDHFPLIANFIEEHYELLKEIDEYRIYARSEKK